MKIKTILATLLGALLLLIACDDTVSEIGLGTRPDEDKISVFDTTIYISAKTVKVDSVYAKTITGYLGEIYDPSYGTIKAGYACQFHPSATFYTDEMTTGKIDSVRLNLFFISSVGDPKAPMEVTVYPLDEQLEKHYYSNVDPSKFSDMNNPVVRHSYTAHNPIISDSLLNEGNYRVVSIPLPISLGENFLEEYKKPEPNSFSSVEAFAKFFPGYYLESSFGKGSIISVEHTQLFFYYERNYETKSPETGNDTIMSATYSTSFNVTKEVVQMNSIISENESALLLPNEEETFIKSPSGVFTQISIPLKEISKQVGRREFNGVSLSLKALPKGNETYPLNFPGRGIIGDANTSSAAAKLLLIEPDSVKNFFESQQVADNYTAYTTTFNSNTYTYTFDNISSLVQHVIDKAPEKEVLDLLLIPVQTTFAYQQSPYYSQKIPVDYTTAYYLFPSAVTLKKDKENMKIRVLASSLEME